ncbi:Gfo/Idh/MocA family oxidoreductase [Micrococcales bacterium 31B]|nr:Gfo/Idh/MocA family oxidoreductase [Micrococcales bacterium 31B]
MGFRTINREGPLRVVVAGAGGMGRAWIRTVTASREVHLVGVADVVEGLAEEAIAELGAAASEIATGPDAVALAQSLEADAIINVTIPAAHHPITVAALAAGLPVLGEKPAAATLAEAVSLVAHAEARGELFMVSQSRRYNPHVEALREAFAGIGGAAFISTQFFKAPRFGGFRDEMEYPLIVDMAIHPFDTVRKILGANPVSVYTESFNPSWSWYRGDASVAVTFAMSDGSRFAYSGSWCQGGAETSWNAEWRIATQGGTLLWDGESVPRGETFDGEPLAVADLSAGYDVEIAGSLAEFAACLRSGETPQGSIADNIFSLAMVEAAVESARRGERVEVAPLLEDARVAALAAETDAAVRAALGAVSFV